MEISGKNLIASKSSGENSTSFKAANPATGETLEYEFFEATGREVNEAVEMADKAFPVYRAKTSRQRAEFLEAIGEEIINLGDQLIERCMAETALPEARLKGERMRTVNQLKLFAAVVREGSWIDARIDTAQPDRQPLPKPDIRQQQIPMGPVGVFGASNFPLAFSVAGGDTASALAAGCTVVVKGHPLHPGTSEMVGRAILKAAGRTGMPEGVFSLVQGQSTQAGMAIVQHPKITAIGFTGSFKGGKAIFDAASRRPVPIPVYAEMGSINPVFILPGALKKDIQNLAQGLLNSLNLGAGQFCTNPGLVVTTESQESGKFAGILQEITSGAACGTMLSEGIRRNYLEGVKRMESTTGVKLLANGSGEEQGNQVRTRIFTTDTQTLLDHPELAEEIFGPSTLAVQAGSKEELLRVAEQMEGHLTATIHGTEDDLQEYADLIRILERKVGRIIFNGFPTGVEVCHAMVHGGPYPATTASNSTSVGTAAIKRFSRPVCYQDFPQAALPEVLRDGNPHNIWRMMDGEWKK